MRESLTKLKRQVRSYSTSASCKRYRTPRLSHLLLDIDKKTYFSASLVTADGGTIASIERTGYKAWLALRDHIKRDLKHMVNHLENYG